MVRATGTYSPPGGAFRYRVFVHDTAQGGKMANTDVQINQVKHSLDVGLAAYRTINTKVL